MRKPQDAHVIQVTTYSLLFGLDEFLLLYESVAKDSWMKGADARSDLKAFHVKVAKEEERALNISAPSLSATGWALVNVKDGSIKIVDCGEISTTQGDSHGRRLRIIRNELTVVAKGL